MISLLHDLILVRISGGNRLFWLSDWRKVTSPNNTVSKNEGRWWNWSQRSWLLRGLRLIKSSVLMLLWLSHTNQKVLFSTFSLFSFLVNVNDRISKWHRSYLGLSVRCRVMWSHRLNLPVPRANNSSFTTTIVWNLTGRARMYACTVMTHWLTRWQHWHLLKVVILLISLSSVIYLLLQHIRLTAAKTSSFSDHNFSYDVGPGAFFPNRVKD